MTRSVSAGLVPGPHMQDVHTFLYYRDETVSAGRLKDSARDKIKAWLTARDDNGKLLNGRVDENGHRFFDLPEPLTINGVTYTAIQAQRKTSSSIDLDAAESLLKAKGSEYYDQVFRAVVVRQFSEDDLFILNQTGVLSDEELDALETEDETFALTAVKE